MNGVDYSIGCAVIYCYEDDRFGQALPNDEQAKIS